MRSAIVRNSINKYGSTVEILDDKNQVKLTTKALIQPSRYVNKNTFGYQYLKMGKADIDTFTYIGPSEIRIDTFPFDTVLRCNENLFIVKRAQKICFEDEVLYVWGLLQKYVPEQNNND